MAELVKFGSRCTKQMASWDNNYVGIYVEHAPARNILKIGWYLMMNCSKRNKHQWKIKYEYYTQVLHWNIIRNLNMIIFHIHVINVDIKQHQRRNLKRHKSKHVEVQFACQLCSHKETRRQLLKYHIRSIHGNSWYITFIKIFHFIIIY